MGRNFWIYDHLVNLETFTRQYQAGRLNDQQFRALAHNVVEEIIKDDLELCSAKEWGTYLITWQARRIIASCRRLFK